MARILVLMKICAASKLSKIEKIFLFPNHLNRFINYFTSDLYLTLW